MRKSLGTIVTEIFIRINSKGVVLSQADFAMSKIASNTLYDGNLLRKAIDYFCHLAISPEFHKHIEDHGDAHDAEGFCNAIKKAKVQGTIVKDRFEVTYFELIKK